LALAYSLLSVGSMIMRGFRDHKFQRNFNLQFRNVLSKEIEFTKTIHYLHLL